MRKRYQVSAKQNYIKHPRIVAPEATIILSNRCAAKHRGDQRADGQYDQNQCYELHIESRLCCWIGSREIKIVKSAAPPRNPAPRSGFMSFFLART